MPAPFRSQRSSALIRSAHGERERSLMLMAQKFQLAQQRGAAGGSIQLGPADIACARVNFLLSPSRSLLARPGHSPAALLAGGKHA